MGKPRKRLASSRLQDLLKMGIIKTISSASSQKPKDSDDVKKSLKGSDLGTDETPGGLEKDNKFDTHSSFKLSKDKTMSAKNLFTDRSALNSRASARSSRVSQRGPRNKLSHFAKGP